MILNMLLFSWGMMVMVMVIVMILVLAVMEGGLIMARQETTDIPQGDRAAADTRRQLEMGLLLLVVLVEVQLSHSSRSSRSNSNIKR